jgi:hypothetical protein
MADIFKVDPKTIIDYGQTYDATALTLARVEAVGTAFVRLHFTVPQTFVGHERDEPDNLIVARILIPRDAMHEMGATLLEEVADAPATAGPTVLRIVH